MSHWLTRPGDVEPCAYRPGEPSRHQILIPTQSLPSSALDQLHAAGARRSGWLFYRNDCPQCSGCVPLRVPVADFVRSKSQRRVWRRNRDLRVEVGAPDVCAQRVALYNRHLKQRDLQVYDQDLSESIYRDWLVNSGVNTIEMSYWLGERLLGIGIIDVGQQDASSVYFYFDPEESKRSLGTYSLLYELHWLNGLGARYHYLGFYNPDCDALRYKANFGPHQRLVAAPGGQRWIDSSPP